jgi:predicted  nucleic acid-binding Zn-ribbon protein
MGLEMQIEELEKLIKKQAEQIDYLEERYAKLNKKFFELNRDVWGKFRQYDDIKKFFEKHEIRDLQLIK